MTSIDPLSGWSQPKSVADWGEKISPIRGDRWLDYISYFVHPDIITLAGRLLFPELIEHEGGVYYKMRFDVAIYEDWKSRLNDVSKIERAINHQHVYDIFHQDKEISD